VPYDRVVDRDPRNVLVIRIGKSALTIASVSDASQRETRQAL
jgi:hypothetical protein